ncbi:hypothetical protein [Streptomyces cylindrosporus]|uniref:Uncharacterized protein n=1 Tax=Streptomyces cylindrosporus TaxID=2927583 RepID=A0ABS9YP50_9ACTN|nr:hypothetical protein [Streptomyces cylindrosporus]MCI3277621.1 hypothetical protein [Streptomyces cylindrosporus]
MTRHQVLAWAAGHPWSAAAAAALVLAALTAALRALAGRTKPAVFAAGTGAIVCTAYSGDTSWRFAAHRLGMHAVDERAAMFAAGEIALLACGIMARANKRATATDDHAGTPGVPGVLVWCITGVQIIPAFAESGFWGGIVRAAIGPVMAGLLWHLAMGLEIRITKPNALSTGLPAQIGHELRERLLSYLGLSVRGRDAAQLTRDRATARAVRLASRRRLGWWGRGALKAAVARSGAAVDDTQRDQLLALLAGRRTADQLRTIDLASPWTARTPPAPASEPLPAPAPASASAPAAQASGPAAFDGPALRRMEPIDAVLRVHAVHPHLAPRELAELCNGYGLFVTEDLVRAALQVAGRDPAQAAPAPAPERVPAQAEPPRLTDVPSPADKPLPGLLAFASRIGSLHLDVVTEDRVRPEDACTVPAASFNPARSLTQVHARVPDGLGNLGYILSRAPGASPGAAATLRRPLNLIRAGASSAKTAPAPRPPAAAGAAAGGGRTEAEELERAREVDADHRRTRGKPASVRALKKGVGVGQPKAERLRALLDAEQNAAASASSQKATP